VCYVSLRTERERKRNMMNVVTQIKQKTQQEENETRDRNTEMDRQRR
jgi:protein-tyrosine phosphatase